MKRTFTFLMTALFLAVGTMWADVNAELTSKYVSVGGDATELTAGTWYALYNHARGCYVSEETSAFKMRKAAIAEGAEAKDVAGKLFKLTAAETDGEYYLMSGNGLYFDFKENNTSAVSASPVAYKIATIGANAGHFYIQHAENDFVADGQGDTENFVCWEKNVPANAGGNNCYHFKPVRLADNYEEFEIVYNYTYGDAVKYTETKKVVVLDSQYPDYPACSVALPLGVTAAAKPEGKVTANATKEIALSVNMPFEYVESLDDYDKLSVKDETTGKWKWYHLIFRPDYGKVLYYGGTADPIDASKTVVDEAKEDAYSWAFVGNPFKGFKVVNKLAGKEKGLQAGNDGGYVGDAAEVFQLTTSTCAENGFFMQSTTGVKKDRFNYSGDKLKYWSGADIGSTFQVKLRKTEEQELIELVAKVEDLLDENRWTNSDEPELGCYTTAGYEALEAAFEDDNRTIESLKNAIEAFRATRNMPIFAIEGAGKDYMKGKSIFVDGEGKYKSKPTDLTDKSMLWAFDLGESEVGVIDEVVVRNVATGELYEGADFIKVTETDPAIEDDGIFLFYKNGTGNPVHVQDVADSDVENIVTWGDKQATSGSAWRFVFVGVTNTAAYDLSEVKEEFAAMAGEFKTLADEELFTVLESLKENWTTQNESVKELAARIEAGDLITKAEVASAMEEMESYFSALESYDEYKVALANAKAVLEELKDWKFAENDQTYAKLGKTVNTVEAEEWFAVWQISDSKSQLENAVAPFYDIDSPLEGTGTGEVEWVDITTGSDAIVNPDLSSLKAPASWGGGFIWNATNNTDYDAENGVMEFVAGENTEASLIQEACPFVGVYRLTGKAYHKGAVNAVMFVGDKTVEIPAAEELTEISIVFEAEGTVYGPTYTEPDYLNIGYRCEFDNAEDVLVVGGFKLEKEEAKSFTLRDKFIQVVNMDSEDGFAGIGYWATDVFAFAEEYNKVLESVRPILDPVLNGQKVLKVKVEKAIADMEALMAKITPVVEYYEGTYKPAVADAEKTLNNLNDASQAYEALAAALDVSEVDAVEDLDVDTRMAAINEALKLVPTAVELDVKETTLTTSGATVQLTATVAGDETEKTVTWESSNEEVATVDENGLVTAVGNGETFIVVYTVDYRITDTCKVTVKIEPTSIALNLSVDTLTTAGATVQLEATVAPEDAEDKTITWTTSDEKVATVDADGKVTAVANGTAVITATAVNGVKATCTIVVAIPEDEGNDEGDDNGIESIEVEGNAVIYDIHGRRVEKMEKGFYIVNGKKVLVK